VHSVSSRVFVRPPYHRERAAGAVRDMSRCGASGWRCCLSGGGRKHRLGVKVDGRKSVRRGVLGSVRTVPGSACRRSRCIILAAGRNGRTDDRCIRPGLREPGSVSADIAAPSAGFGVLCALATAGLGLICHAVTRVPAVMPWLGTAARGLSREARYGFQRARGRSAACLWLSNIALLHGLVWRRRYAHCRHFAEQ
jgi:hypothetical protein